MINYLTNLLNKLVYNIDMLLNIISLISILFCQTNNQQVSEICGDNNYYPVPFMTSKASNYFNDSYYDSQWYIKSMELEKAWKIYKPQKTVKVAVFDKVFYLNDEIKEFVNVKQSIAFEKSYKTPFIDNMNDSNNKHGSFVTNLIAAKQNNNFGIAGITNDVELYLINVLPEDDRFPMIGTSKDYSALINAINYCDDTGVDIINMSLHIYTDDTEVKNTISNFNGLIVCSSGNDTYDLDVTTKSFPTCWNLDNVISVGAIDKNNNLWEESNHSKNYVDVLGPGVNITSLASDVVEAKDGTSFSTPIVTGLAAMYLSMYPNSSPALIKERIMNSVLIKSSKLLDYSKTGGPINALKVIHDHDYIYNWLDYKKHNYICTCLESKIEEGHIVAGGGFNNGKRYANCLKCGGLAEMGFVSATNNNDDTYFELINGEFYINKTQYYDEVLNLSYEDYIKGDYL